MSPSGVNGQILRSVIISQNVCNWRSRFFGVLPAMIAELIAPMETPETQSGSTPASLHRLVHAGLIGAERAAALQNKRDAIAPLRTPASRQRRRRHVVGKAGTDVVHGEALEMAGANQDEQLCQIK